MIKIIIITVLATVLVIRLLQKLMVWLATVDAPEVWMDVICGQAYSFCTFVGWAIPEREPEDVPGLDRYPEDGSNPFIPFITKIVVPSEYARQQMVLAIRYLHDLHVDTDYMAVNNLVHCYTDDRGEPTDHPSVIVVETPNG